VQSDVSPDFSPTTTIATSARCAAPTAREISSSLPSTSPQPAA
jgi:hypothetical protein